jgi:hypothetical protein
VILDATIVSVALPNAQTSLFVNVTFAVVALAGAAGILALAALTALVVNPAPSAAQRRRTPKPTKSSPSSLRRPGIAVTDPRIRSI